MWKITIYFTKSIKGNVQRYKDYKAINAYTCCEVGKIIMFEVLSYKPRLYQAPPYFIVVNFISLKLLYLLI